MIKRSSFFALAALLVLAGCKTGYNRTYARSTDPNPPPCATATANPNISSDGYRVFKMLAGLTCGQTSHDGYLMGQNAGAGNQLKTQTNLSYDRLFDGLRRETQHTPAIISLDYEEERLFTAAELRSANEDLKKHWDAGGVVAVSWTPLSPWRNNAQDPANNPGSASDALYEQDSNINLAHLLDDTQAVHDVWRRKLDAVAEALKDLQDKGVPVLWRPLPEMNRRIYWWGLDASAVTGDAQNSERFTDLWEDMYEYLTKDKGLNNLLWVYSPGESAGARAVNWAYPGDKFVDVVAGIARNDSLTIADYRTMVDLNRPFGMAYYGPTPAEMGGQYSNAGTFDSRTYGDRLNGSYPAAGFWISWHSYSTATPEGTVPSHQALVDSLFIRELTNRSYIHSLERLKDRKLR